MAELELVANPICEIGRMEGNETGIAPPEPLLSDYIEMIYLSFVIALGIPSNAVILRKLFFELKRTPKDSVKSGFLLLKINLNISDIFLLMMAFVKLIWMYTYEWRFGDFNCRIYQFLSIFSLYISSNIVVCIAIDRLRNVLYANKMQRGHKHINPVKLILIISWACAFFCSLPQFYFFRNFNIAPYFLGFQTETKKNEEEVEKTWNNGAAPYPSFIMSITAQSTYNIAHLIIVFWGPVAIMMISYVIIAYKLMQYSLKGVTSQTEVTRKDTIEEESVQEALITHNTENGPNARFWSRIKSAPIIETIRRPSRFMITVPPSSRRPSITQIAPKVPAWRRQLRSKVFRTTLLVVLTHVICWFPYNALGLMKYINKDVYEEMSTNTNVFKDLQILITLINPFLYGFSK